MSQTYVLILGLWGISSVALLLTKLLWIGVTMYLEDLFMEAELAPSRKKAQKVLKKATKKELKARKKELLENDQHYMALKEACK